MALAAAASFSPLRWEQRLSAVETRACAAFVWWASIVLASTPSVVMGAVFGAAVSRRPANDRHLAPLLLLLSPGCDCATSGYAPALVRARPALAGFVTMWSSAAGPLALCTTYAVLGMHLLAARAAGAAAASLVAAFGWQSTGASRAHHGCDPRPLDVDLRATLARALCGVAWSAVVAALLLCSGASRWLATSSLPTAAIAGALLSPCATADAVLARVLLHSAETRAVFLIASQCMDLRQLIFVVRTFGPRRAVMGAVAGAIGCAVAAVVAR